MPYPPKFYPCPAPSWWIIRAIGACPDLLPLSSTDCKIISASWLVYHIISYIIYWFFKQKSMIFWWVSSSFYHVSFLSAFFSTTFVKTIANMYPPASSLANHCCWWSFRMFEFYVWIPVGISACSVENPWFTIIIIPNKCQMMIIRYKNKSV